VNVMKICNSNSQANLKSYYNENKKSIIAKHFKRSNIFKNQPRKKKIYFQLQEKRAFLHLKVLLANFLLWKAS